MYLCNDGHEEVCIEDRTSCPVCEALRELNAERDTAATLKEELKNLQDQFHDLQQDYDSLQGKCEQLEENYNELLGES